MGLQWHVFPSRGPRTVGTSPDGSGLGVRRYTLNGRMYYGHSGASFGASTEMLFDPASGITTVVIVNQNPGPHDFVHVRAALASMEMARAGG